MRLGRSRPRSSDQRLPACLAEASARFERHVRVDLILPPVLDLVIRLAKSPLSKKVCAEEREKAQDRARASPVNCHPLQGQSRILRFGSWGMQGDLAGSFNSR